MPEITLFMGRVKELEKIKEAIDAWGERRIICVYGPGGIGKTRLLQEVREQHAQNAFVTDILDFDDIALRIPANIEFTIARQVGQKMFEVYLQGLRTFHQMRRTGASAGELARKRLEIRQTFKNGLKEFSAEHRIVLLLDTTDTLEGTEAWNYIITDLPRCSENLAIIIAGRNADKIYKELQSETGQDVQFIKLKPLDRTDRLSYLQHKQELVHATLEPKLAENLISMAGGLPIFIDLAVEWLAHDIPMPWLSDSDLKDSKSLSDDESTRRQKEFEHRLVNHIAQIRTPMDRLTLAMSHVYPLDEELMIELLRMPQAEATELFEEAKTYAFVKSLPDGRITLHDEMRRLVHEHVWPEVEVSRWRWYSELAVDCLDNQSQALQKQINQPEERERLEGIQEDQVTDPFTRREVQRQLLWTLRARALYHRMYLDLDQGFDEFSCLFHRAYTRREADFFIILQDTAERHSSALSEKHRIRLELSEDLLVTLRGGPEESILCDVCAKLGRLLRLDIDLGFVEFDRLFKDAFNTYDADFCARLLDTAKVYYDGLSPEDQIRLEISEGLLAILHKDRKTAAERIREGLDQLEQLVVTKDLDHIYNSLGYCYRLLGEWESAIASYERALYFSAQEKDAEQIAETMNNIANICRFNGDFELGLRYTKLSVKIRERLGDRLSIANSCYVRGMISWEIGNTAEAAAYLARARELYQELGDQVRVAWVDKYTGYFHYRIGDVDTATKYLKQAEAIFRERQVKSDLADTLNELSRVMRRRNVTGRAKDAIFEQAEQYALEGFSIAREIGDHYKIAECTLSLCMLYYRWGREHHIHGRNAQAQEYYEQALERYNEGFSIARDYNYIDLLSVYRAAAGNVAYDEGMAQEGKTTAIRKWDEAFEHYLEECRIAASYKGIRFDRALSEIAFRLMKLPSPGLTQRYCDRLTNWWKRRGLDHQYPQLIAECEQIKEFLGTPEKLVVEHLAQAQIDLSEMGNWEEAAKMGQQVLEHNRVYLRSPTVVHALNISAFALRQLGRFSEARRLCTQSLHIGGVVGDQAAIAESHYVMGTNHWIVGSTAEAATHFRLAREIFEELKDVVGVARVHRYEGFLYYRIGNLKKALELLEKARVCFEKKQELADLIDVLAVETRVLSESGQYEEAKQTAEWANKIARELGNNYVIAETLISLYGLYSREKQIAQTSGNEAKAAHHSNQAQQCLEEGAEIAHRFGYDLLISVYEQLAGDIAFNEGRLGQAFEHYVAALEHGARFEYARLHRTLDPCIDRLVQLPVDLVRYYADYVIREWKARELDVKYPDVVNMFELSREYREYVSQA